MLLTTGDGYDNSYTNTSTISSTRFPGKMMEKLNGVPLIEHVYNKCVATGLDTYVLTDAQEVYNYIGGGKCLMTQDAENLSLIHISEPTRPY